MTMLALALALAVTVMILEPCVHGHAKWIITIVIIFFVTAITV